MEINGPIEENAGFYILLSPKLDTLPVEVCSRVVVSKRRFFW